jgi:hypothetical protein
VTAALVRLLDDGEADLRIEAAWALSRVGDQTAMPALSRALASGYSLLEARAARALAAFGEVRLVPEMMRRLTHGCDLGLRLACASALGELRAKQATGAILMLRPEMPNEIWRSELDLAMARLAGNERYFIQLWRQMRKEPGTAAAREIERLRKRIIRHSAGGPGINGLLDACAQSLARDDLAAGAAAMADLIHRLHLDGMNHTRAAVLKDCARRLRDDRDGLSALPLALNCILAEMKR